jgi:polyisoprenyl-teichoic acid--peptidoglycan teichoic acid transferase
MERRLRYSLAVAGKDKPYRVYRGGRAKGPIRHEVPKQPRGARQRDDGRYRYPGPQPAKRGRRRWPRRLAVGLVLLLALALVWGVLGFLAFRSGVSEANARLDPRAVRALSPPDGAVLATPANTLLLGVDRGLWRGGGSARSDAIVLVRTDPDDHRIAFLSIPRDLRVEIPRHGTQKVNAAFALGGPTLAAQTVANVTGLPIHHVAVVDFGTFGEVIDALGGVTIDVPKRILSNKFECPRKSQAACDRWRGWRFRKGEQEMDGKRALIYARVRQNQLNPGESDITRGERQQAVLQAIADETVSLGTYLRGPFSGDDLAKPLATDLSAFEFVQLGWVKFRTPDDGVLRCRLGGTISNTSEGSFIVGTEENVSVIAMVTGKTAPQPPPPGSGPFGPGCLVGRGR